MPHETPKLLAIETSTDALSVAVGDPGVRAVFQGPGAAQSSASLLPAVQDLLQQAGWTLAALDAIVFARGPGAFTGLRTACAVAQGLAYGVRPAAHPDGLPVLPVDARLVDLDLDTRTVLLKLPPRIREELLQGLREQGPEGYQQFIRNYYQRLAKVKGDQK